MKRALTSLCLLILVASSLALPSGVLAAPTNCSSLGIVNQFVSSQSTTADAITIQSSITPSNTTFGHCTGFDLVHGPSAWISLTANAPIGGIVQVGIIDCASQFNPNDTVCDNHPDVRNIFWAIGGCNGYTANAQYVGPASLGRYLFRIDDDPINHKWTLWKAAGSNPLVKFKDIPWSDPAVNCWATGPKVATASAERWDPGDGWGTQADPLKYSGLIYQRSNNPSLWLNMGGGACFQQDAPDGHCVGTSDGYLYWDT